MFRQQLDTATKQVIEFTRQVCINELVSNYKYILVPNVRTYDEHLNSKEHKILVLWNKYANILLTADEVVDLLVYDNKVPLWINISILESREKTTIIELLCSRRLRDDEELYHKEEVPPFHILGPPIPPEIATNKNESGKISKYDLNWKIRTNSFWWRKLGCFLFKG